MGRCESCTEDGCAAVAPQCVRCVVVLEKSFDQAQILYRTERELRKKAEEGLTASVGIGRAELALREKAEKTLDDVKEERKEYAALRERARAGEKSLASLREELDEDRESLEEMRNERDAWNKDACEKRILVASQASHLGVARNSIKELEKALADMEDERDEANSEAAVVQEALARSEEKLKKVVAGCGDFDPETPPECCEHVINAVGIVEKKADDAQRAAQAFLSGAAEGANAIRRERDKALGEIVTLSNRNASLEEQLTGAKLCAAVYQKTLADLEEESETHAALDQMKAERDSALQSWQMSRSIRKELESRINTIKRSLARHLPGIDEDSMDYAFINTVTATCDDLKRVCKDRDAARDHARSLQYKLDHVAVAVKENVEAHERRRDRKAPTGQGEANTPVDHVTALAEGRDPTLAEVMVAKADCETWKAMHEKAIRERNEALARTGKYIQLLDEIRSLLPEEEEEEEE